jgi:hypothetical protein
MRFIVFGGILGSTLNCEENEGGVLGMCWFWVVLGGGLRGWVGGGGALVLLFCFWVNGGFVGLLVVKGC